MRTNIDIDDKLMEAAMKATGTATKKAAVEASLRQTIALKRQEGIKKWFGKVQWEGDLNAMRAGLPSISSDEHEGANGGTDVSSKAAPAI